MEKKTVQEWREKIEPALLSKQRDFKIIGYKDVSKEEIWQCLEEKVWKGNPKKRLYQVVEDIFHLSTATYMSYMTVNALKTDDDDLMASIQAVTEGENK